MGKLSEDMKEVEQDFKDLIIEEFKKLQIENCELIIENEKLKKVLEKVSRKISQKELKKMKKRLQEQEANKFIKEYWLIMIISLLGIVGLFYFFN